MDNVYTLNEIVQGVCVAPPIVVGAWPIAGTLWRLFEYYYPEDESVVREMEILQQHGNCLGS